MWSLLILIGLAILLRRQIVEQPLNAISLFLGLLAGFALLRILAADRGWNLVPFRGAVAGVIAVAGVVMATRIARNLLKGIWPEEREKDELP